MSDVKEREFLDAVSRRTGLSHREITEAMRDQRERDARNAESEALTAVQTCRCGHTEAGLLAAWRALTDDQRLELIDLCCRGCGSLDTGCQCWNDE